MSLDPAILVLPSALASTILCVLSVISPPFFLTYPKVLPEKDEPVPLPRLRKILLCTGKCQI